MITHKQATLDHEGDFTDVYECEICGARTIYKDSEHDCKRMSDAIAEHHLEEFEAGIL
jgi:DNA-directed RNA polymerase subunit RPC12/RpoP